MNIEPTNTNNGCLTFPFRIISDLVNSFSNPKTRRSTIILISSIFGFCVICFTGLSIADGIGISNTPTPTFDLISMQQTAQSSALLSFTQTALALPTSTFTITATSTITNTPVSIFNLIPTATQTAIPTQTSIPTVVIPSPVVIIPTQQPPSSGGSGSYDNNGDGKVTCKDFQTQAAAQQAYNAGYTNLDGNDNDGKACETLP